LYIARLLLPESPRWLVISNKPDKAEETLKFIENHVERNLGRKLPEPNILNISLDEIATEKVPVSEVFHGKNLKLSAVWLPLYFLSFFGWYFFITALPSILVEAGYAIIKALTYTLPVSIAAAAFAAVPVFTIDTRIGRRGTLIYSAAILIVSATLYILIRTPLALIIFGSINSGMVTIWADVVHQWGPETYPNRIRASATGFNYASARAGAALAPYAGVMIVHYYGLTGIFITGIVVALTSIALSFAIPETRKKILETIRK
jgi:putative MFS transporter